MPPEGQGTRIFARSPEHGDSGDQLAAAPLQPGMWISTERCETWRFMADGANPACRNTRQASGLLRLLCHQWRLRPLPTFGSSQSVGPPPRSALPATMTQTLAAQTPNPCRLTQPTSASWLMTRSAVPWTRFPAMTWQLARRAVALTRLRLGRFVVSNRRRHARL